MSARLHRWRLTLMEYQFEVIHRDGKSNLGPDALSRIKLENTKNQDEKTIFMVKTRANKNKANKTNNNNTNPTSTNNHNSLYYIEENPKMIINKSNYDHIFFLFHKINCTMHKKLQHKTKKIIKIEKINYGELLSIDDDKSIVLTPNLIRDKVNIENARKSIEIIKAYANTKYMENIALNIDFQDARSYFEFKFLLQKTFANTHTKITLYLNKTIELTELEDIQNVLKNYHDTLLGGHAAFDRMYNLIRRFYTWYNMSIDIKNYIKNCSICQTTKIGRHTKQPIIITTIPLKCFDPYL